MSLIWGWGPYSIRPEGEELQLADKGQTGIQETYSVV
jgi:hypothetical protein